MPTRQKRIVTVLAWTLPLGVAAGFARALPARGQAVRIADLSLVAEEEHPFDRSVHVGLDAHSLLDLRANIDVTPPNAITSNTNVDVTTPNAITSNTNVDVTTPSAVTSNTNVDVTTPNAITSNTNVGVTTPNAIVSSEFFDDDDAVSFFSMHATLPKPQIAAGVRVVDPNAAG